MNGELFSPNAEDYFFIAGNRFPWHQVPDVVVGRPAYDNFLVAIAIREGVSVVDATASVLAVHQSGRDANYAGHLNSDWGVNAAAVKQRYKQFEYQAGTTICSQYMTMVTTHSAAAAASSYSATSTTSPPGGSEATKSRINQFDEVIVQRRNRSEIKPPCQQN
jgi:hypothetical protein